MVGPSVDAVQRIARRLERSQAKSPRKPPPPDLVAPMKITQVSTRTTQRLKLRTHKNHTCLQKRHQTNNMHTSPQATAAPRGKVDPRDHSPIGG